MRYSRSLRSFGRLACRTHYRELHPPGRERGGGAGLDAARLTDELFGPSYDSVVRGGVHVLARTIDLTSAEFDLLWLLASNAGRVLSREEIFTALRGIEYDGQDRSIDVRVSRIRPKIGDDPIHPRRIKTVRSKGYLFVKEA